ncbi:hypothetical protein DFO50_101652 [Microvirgula sp. AG722]|nr:hypothetical protein DFO50_101652 [Microvirgula sp. AG722]
MKWLGGALILAAVLLALYGYTRPEAALVYGNLVGMCR